MVVAKLFGYDRFQTKNPSAFANLVLASLAGIIRVVWVGVFSYQEGLAAEFNLYARIGSGVVLGVLLFVALTNVLEINRQYSLALRGLLKTRNQLIQLRKLSSAKFASSQLELAKDIRGVVEPRLSEIAKLLRTQTLSSRLRTAISKDLKDILEKQVRPLNRELRALGKEFDNPKLDSTLKRSVLFRIPSAVQADLAISPFWIFMLLLGVMPFSLYIFENEQWAGLGVLVSIIDYLMIRLARDVLRRQKLVPLETAIAQYLLLTAQLVILNLAILLIAGYPEASAGYVVLMTFITLIFTIFAVGLEAVQEHNRSDFLAQIAKNNSRIERELGLLNQKVWVEKRRWALTIHGTVQGSLTAALARLKNGEHLDSAELRRISKHVLQAKRGLSGPTESSFDLGKAIRQQLATWRGILKITVDTRSPGFEILAADRWASFCANEIIKEGLSNAFRHGAAKNVYINFEGKQEGFLNIILDNDGKAPDPNRETGLGSQLLDEIARPWTLSKIPNGVRLDARIPVAKVKKRQKSLA